MFAKVRTHDNCGAISKQRSVKFDNESVDSLTQEQTGPAIAARRDVLGPRSFAPSDVLGLQRTMGNRAVGKLLWAKSNVGKQEDDRRLSRQAQPGEEALLDGPLEWLNKRKAANGEQEDELSKTVILQRKASPSPAMPAGSESDAFGCSYQGHFIQSRDASGADLGDVGIRHDAASTTIQTGEGVANAPPTSIRRTIGDGHDLSSARFSGNAVLEAIFDNQSLMDDGDIGTAVRLVQQALVDLGYELPRFGVDGDFGDETEAAVRAFQVDAGTGVDGVVGFETISFLDSRVQGQPVVPPPAPAVGGALPAANVIAQPGAAPSIALGACDWGLTFPENVAVDMVAVRNGANWVPVVSGLTGNYSLQARLLPAQTEVTGPGGNTAAANFCAQVTELDALGNCPGVWYMRSAVVEHERVHATFFRPALITVAAAIEASIEVLSVPHVAGMNAGTAATAIRALPAFAAAVTAAQGLWLAQILADGGGHPNVDAATAAAEHTIVDPMVQQICAHAGGQGWPACSPPCP